VGVLPGLVADQVRYPGWDEHRLTRAIVDRDARGGGLQDDGADGDNGILRAGVSVPSTNSTGTQPQALHQKSRLAVGVDRNRHEGVTLGDIRSGDVTVGRSGTDYRQWQSETENGEDRGYD
jgi:hypothetical protein